MEMLRQNNIKNKRKREKDVLDNHFFSFYERLFKNIYVFSLASMVHLFGALSPN